MIGQLRCCSQLTLLDCQFWAPLQIVQLKYRKVWLISAPSLISAYFLISAYIVPVLSYSVLSACTLLGGMALVHVERRFLRSRGAICGWSWLALRFSRLSWVVIAKRLVGRAIQGSLRVPLLRVQYEGEHYCFQQTYTTLLGTENCTLLHDQRKTALHASKVQGTEVVGGVKMLLSIKCTLSNKRIFPYHREW